MAFNIKYKFVFIDSFQCFRSSLNSLVKNFCKDGSTFLSQEFDSDVFRSS